METQRIPTGLWDSLQDICYRHDVTFLQDVSRMIGIPANELKRRILGTRGMPTAILVEQNSPWWVETQCPIMEKNPSNMWIRCNMYCESNGTCWTHRRGRGKLYDDPYFAELPKRWPIRLEGELYWVDKSGIAYSVSGHELPDVHIDRVESIAHCTKGGTKLTLSV